MPQPAHWPRDPTDGTEHRPSDPSDLQPPEGTAMEDAEIWGLCVMRYN